MAELLILNRPCAPPEAGPEDKALWRRGDIVTVRDDGHSWGAAECEPDFVMLRVPGLNAEEIAHCEQPATDDAGNVVAKRMFQIDLSRVPTTKVIKQDQLDQLLIQRS